MQMEIKRLEPAHAARVLGAVAALTTVIALLLALPFGLLLGGEVGLAAAHQGSFWWSLLLLPLGNGLAMALAALVISVAYNLLAPRLGGLRVEVESLPGER